MWLDSPRNPKAPLAGLKVLELARVLAGPWAGQILADLGADVIKIESPEGDGTRQWGPPWIERENGEREAAYYHAANRGKRSIVADFRNEEDLARVRELAASADVALENFKTGKLAKFGLDYDSLAKANPALVYCSITGFGQTGPRAREAGYDFVIQAMSGFMALTGEPQGQPMKMGISISDLVCGLYAVIGIQAALAMRERTGRGQHVDMSLLDCSVGLLASQAMHLLTTGENPPRMGNEHAQVSAYGVFPVADGEVVLAPANDGLFLRDDDGTPQVIDRATGKPAPHSDASVKPALQGEVKVKGGGVAVPAFMLMADAYLTDDYAPETVAPQVGISAARIRQLAADLAEAAFASEVVIDQPWTDWKGEKHDKMIGRPVSMHAMRGISAHSNGFQTCRALHMLQLLA